MSSTVERLAVSKSDAAHRRAAELVKRQRQLNDRLDAYFREIAEVKELLEGEGSLWGGPVMDPPLEAAFHAWQARGPVETRLELRGIRPIPMMELE